MRTQEFGNILRMSDLLRCLGSTFNSKEYFSLIKKKTSVFALEDSFSFQVEELWL